MSIINMPAYATTAAPGFLCAVSGVDTQALAACTKAYETARTAFWTIQADINTFKNAKAADEAYLRSGEGIANIIFKPGAPAAAADRIRQLECQIDAGEKNLLDARVNWYVAAVDLKNTPGSNPENVEFPRLNRDELNVYVGPYNSIIGVGNYNARSAIRDKLQPLLP
jgi:hypothetical protein